MISTPHRMEMNWALGANGATIADVSHEAAHVPGTAANLLSEAEDQLWITSEAPQHVTLHLDAAHPPLWFAGWHVWHDYVTNPKRVEVAAGETMATMTPLLVCQALPGAGTQVWRLPRPIPPQHRYVRFTVVETFGPGPTYFNNVVLLAADPGPDFSGSAPSRGVAVEGAPSIDPAIAATIVGVGANASSPPTAMRSGVGGCMPVAPHASHLADPSQAAVGAPFVSSRSRTSPAQTLPDDRPPRSSSAAGGDGGGGYGLSGGNCASRPAPASLPSAALVSPRSAPGGRRYGGTAPAASGAASPDDSVGVFTAPSRGGGGSLGLNTPTGAASGTGGGGGGSGRMSQLLRDLDEDIRSLRPIRSVSPTKNMLLYVPQEPPRLLTNTTAAAGVGSGEGDEDDQREAVGAAAMTAAPVASGRRGRHRRRHGGDSDSDSSNSSSSKSYGSSSSYSGAGGGKRRSGRCGGNHRGDSQQYRHSHHHRSRNRRATGNQLLLQQQPQPQHQLSPSPVPAPAESAAAVCTYTDPAAPPQVLGAPVGANVTSAGVLERIGALEQAVASLTQTVRHQREDITMMKRLLLQQATERRAQQEQQRADQRAARSEAEEWRRRYEREHREREREAKAARSGSLVAVPQPQPPAAAAAPSVPVAAADLRLSRHRIDIDFPEDALRGFVQAVLDEKLKRQLKRSEAKVLGRLDSYLRDVVASIADGVDERVRWHLDQASAAAAAAPAPSFHGAHAGTGAAPQQHQPQQHQTHSFTVPSMSINQTAISSNRSSGGSGGVNASAAEVSVSASGPVTASTAQLRHTYQQPPTGLHQRAYTANRYGLV